jgi:hypothetical protein
MSAVRRNIGNDFGMAGFRAAADAIVEAALAGLKDAADFVLEESQKQVPAEDGRHDIGGLDLKETGKVTEMEGQHKVAISYAGPYAVYQHELLHLKHERGGNAKFLERPLVDNREREFEIIADRVREVTGGD